MFHSLFTHFAAVVAVHSQSAADWETEYEYSTFLDESHVFELFWTPDQDGCTVDIGVRVETDSYAAFGISESGGMMASDIVIGWITPDGEYILQNRFALSESRPQLFESQSGIVKRDGWKEDINGIVVTFLQFSKELFPDFDANANDVKVGTTRVIYAWGDEAMEADAEPAKHCFTCRAPQSVNLLQGESVEVEMPSDVEYHDVVVNEHTIPSDDTTYHCSLHALPPRNETHHMVRVDPFIEPAENEGTVHHMLLYYCPERYMNESDVGKAWICEDMYQNMAPYMCRGNLIIGAWAIGGKNFYYPHNVGLEIMGDDSDSIQYVLLEIHYDNPLEMDGIVDRSGLRLHYTPTLREHSAQVVMMGMNVHPYAQFVPPGLSEARNIGYCSADCVTGGMQDNQTEVYAFANQLHMHVLGRKQLLRHIRDGVELRPIDLNVAYDFDYQQTVSLPEMITIKQGDSFIVECFYDSSQREFMTYGGESTREEMCLTFLYVYPKPKLAGCWTNFVHEDVNRFYEEAIEKGFFVNATFDNVTQMYTGFYDVTVEGAQQFYDDFQTGEIYEPAERVAGCVGMDMEDLPGNFARIPVPKAGVDYEEYEVGNYYECSQGATKSGDGFQWDSWYVYVVGAVLVALVFGYGIWVLVCRARKASDAYERVTDDVGKRYGSNQDISMQKHDNYLKKGTNRM